MEFENLSQGLYLIFALSHVFKIKMNTQRQAPGSSKCQSFQEEDMIMYVTNYFHKPFSKDSILDWIKPSQERKEIK